MITLTRVSNINIEALSGVGEQRNKAIYIRGTREQKSKTEGNRGTKAILGNRENKNQDFDFGEQGKMPIFIRGTREQYPPPTPGRASTLESHIVLMKNCETRNSS